MDKPAHDMKQEQKLFNVESDVAGYIGVLIDRRPDGSIITRQEGLSKQVVETLFLEKTAPPLLLYALQPLHIFQLMMMANLLSDSITMHLLLGCSTTFRDILA